MSRTLPGTAQHQAADPRADRPGPDPAPAPPDPDTPPRGPSALVFATRVWPDPSAIRAAVTACEARLRTHGADAAAARLCALVLAELLNNVAEHAFRDLAPVPVEVEVRARRGSLYLAIADRGRPMPGGALPAPCLPDLAVARADMPEGGWGWHLVRSLATSLDYRREDGTNRLRVRLDPQGPA
ncbi:ATP-binding protein [Roseivivax isoporae]|uniref:Histidine kinase/HSP90-like ATPase domain-containing protein n=1 Tax=Roseivivax isoporae LMG 25204 TaxID=1449351 RepID=X7F556_9RHOB|nr:ATP-binding protein [Roseivivax isoporae]ETX28007.1 hypothetical protein RISW2_10345 [Roseivivax isoporae LMG 25204]